MPVKLAAFVISAVVTGMAGGLWFYFIGQAMPQFAFDPLFDLSVVVMAFFGGLGTLSGPLLGALIIEPAQQWLTLQYTNEYLSEILLGVLFLAVILRLPRGVIPTAAERIAAAAASPAAAGQPGPRRPGQCPGAPGPGRGREAAAVTALLRAEGVSKAFGGVQALQRLHGRGGAGQHHRPDRAERLGQDHAVQHHDRLRAGRRRRGLPRRQEDHEPAAAAGVRARHRPDLPAHPDLPPADRDGEHAGRRAARRQARPRNPLARAGGNADRRRAMELLEFTGIADHAGALADTLSYGQRKLLELSYVLVADPAIVLLDEPAGGVNPSLIQHLAGRIRELNAAGKTFLIVEHNMDFVMSLCGHVTVLDYGTVVASGPPAIIRSDPRVLDAYLGITEEDDDASPR